MNHLPAAVFGVITLVLCARYAFELYVFLSKPEDYERVAKQWTIREGGVEDYAGEEVREPNKRLLFSFPAMIILSGAFTVILWISF